MESKTTRFYFNPVSYTFALSYPKAFLDKYEVELLRAPKEESDEAWLDIRDLKKIFSPEINIDWDSDSIIIRSGDVCITYLETEKKWLIGETDADELRILPERDENNWLLPICHVMEQGFGWYAVRKQTFFRITRDKACLEMALQEMEYYRNVIRGKQVGELYKTIWNSDVNKYLPCRLYIPTYSNDRKPLPLIIGLHGGKGSSDSIFENTDRKFSYYAEEMGFILMAPDACIYNSTYGCHLPPEGFQADVFDFRGDEKEMWEKKVSEDALYQEICWVMDQWPIDREQVFLMGNSMGGIGTFYFASRHPELFQAISPAGAAPRANEFDVSGLKGMPIYFVAGTEDSHGYDHIVHAYQVFKEKGLNIRLRTVGGGTHSGAWIDVLEETLRVLLKQMIL